MKLHDSTTIIVGSPGCGKTTTLVKLIEDALASGIAPDRIGYVSFTRRALAEARDRMMSKFGLAKTALPWFRTLHSMGYYLLKLNDSNIMDSPHYGILGRSMGLSLDGRGSVTDLTLRGKGPVLVHHENLARNRCLSLRDHWSQNVGEFSLPELRQFASAYRDYKSRNSLVDFTDILTMAEGNAETPEFDLLLVDEAQDLSLLQWRWVQRLAERAGRVYVAGDSNQAIFTWAGADVDTFVGLTGETKVLGQGYRMARQPHALAAKVASHIKVSHGAVFAPRDADGAVRHVRSVDGIDLAEGEWLVLARTRYTLADAQALMRRRVGKGAKVTFSTIHGAKGAEAENVVLFSDMSPKVYDNWLRDPDAERRVFYVGVSRTRSNLYIVAGMARRHFDFLRG